MLNLNDFEDYQTLKEASQQGMLHDPFLGKRLVPEVVWISWKIIKMGQEKFSLDANQVAKEFKCSPRRALHFLLLLELVEECKRFYDFEGNLSFKFEREEMGEPF